VLSQGRLIFDGGVEGGLAAYDQLASPDVPVGIRP
jgi:hypothetical protein